MLSKLLTMLRTALVCWIPLTAAAMAQSTINVGPGQAYTTIQSGINAAVNGDTVLVAANTNNAPYYENIDFKGKAIAVYAIANGGPFAIIDGGGGGPVVTFKSGEGRNSILSGFTIQNGGGVTNVFDTGGIYIAGSSPTISNNTITHNFCQGIYAYDSSPLIQGNEIDNTLDDGKHGCSFGGGAAIWLFGSLTSSGSSTPLPPVVIGNTLQNNTQSGVEDAGGNGGAGIAVWTTNAAIENNIIRNNLSHGQGAGIHLEDSGNLVVQNLIYNNEAGGGGGGLDVNGAYGPVTTFIANNTFANNTYGSGGGSSIDEAVAQIFFGPFTGSGNTIAFVNNIVAGSSTEPSVACGSPSYIDRGSNAIILDHNLFYNAVGPTFYLCPDPTGIYGNIKADPKFANAASDFHLAAGSPAIDAGNNSVNAFLSTNTIAEPLTLTTDVEGNARLQDATGVGYPIIDMGAYEFAGSKDANATTLLLTASTYYSSAGVPFTLTTKAISGNGTVTGPITFIEDGITLGTVNLDGTGTAVESTGLTPGLHRFLSTYPGQGVFTAATSIEAIVEVNLYSVGLTLTSSLNPSIVGQTVTFTVTLSSLDTNQLGPITLTDGFNNTVLATLTPNASGVATFSISTLALGNHYITATYAGDATHDSAYANVFQRVVSGYATNTTLMCAVNPITVGGTTLLTATVSSSSGTPTGSIAFADNGAALGTQSLSGGAASLTYTGLVVGTHTLTATYVPTGAYAASAAAGSCSEVVNPIPVTAALTVAPSTVNAGSTVALTATIAPVSPYSGVPTGTVNFFANGVAIGIEPMSNGVAVLNTSTLPAGTDTITCTYSGDSTFAFAACTPAVPVTVIGPPTLALTITTVGGGPQAVSTVAAQTPVALVAAVAANGTAVTAGQVNFCDATAAHCTDIHLLGTAQLNSAGVAVLRFVPGLGSHSYKAVLAATKTFGAATSNTAALAVTGKVASSTVLVATGGQGDYTLTATVTGDSAVFPTGTIPFIDTTNANASLGSATLVAGTRTQSFASPTTLSTGVEPVAVAAGDFNNDGKPDLAIINIAGSSQQVGSSLQIFVGNGDGTFSAGTKFSTFTALGLECLVVADFNDDGNADIAVVDESNLYIFLGNGDGTFTVAASAAAGLNSESLATGDFNGDGIVDLAVGHTGGSVGNIVSILLGKGDGTFTAAPSVLAQSAPYFVAAGDFNGDGKADLAAIGVYGTEVNILLGNGDGTFTAGTNISGLAEPTAITTADFNGDGKIDLAVSTENNGNPSVFLGKGDGTFTQAASALLAGGGDGISVGDFNQDGIADLVLSKTYGKTVDVFLGHGDGTFGTPNQLSISGQSTSTAIADFDGNGLPDIATNDIYNSSAQVFLNEVSSTATATVTNVVPVGTGTHYAEASYAGDAIYNPSVSNLVPLIAGLPPTTTVASVSPNPSTYGQPVVFSVHVAPVTANASVPSGQVVFTFCHGAQDTVTLDANGNGSFLYPPPGNANVVAEPVGSCAFTAEYMGDSKFESSTSTAVAYVVVPSPSTTAVVASPNPAYQGQVVTLTATITGVPSPTLNPVTGNPIPPAQTPGTGTVQFFDGSTLIGTAAVNGSNQAVLTTSSLAAGTHSITAVYSGDANLGGSGSGSCSEVILASTFTIALSPTTITLAAGQPGSVAVQLASVGLFAGPLTLTYGALPMYATAKMTPGTVTLAAGGTGAATFSLNTVVKAESVTPVRPGSRAVPGVFAAVVLLMLPWVRGRRKRLARLMAMVMAAVVLQGMTGCTNVSYLLSTVAPGTYAVPITATDANGNAKSAVLTVVVTP